jgi:undecaprenyl-diphosphatase
MKTFLFYIHFLFFILLHFFKVLENVDVQILEFINHNRFTPLDQFFILVTHVATVITYSFPIILILYSIFKHRFLLQRKSWLILISMTINSAIIDIIKNYVKRPRPFITHPSIHNLIQVSTSSFPSGHTAEVFMLATSFTLLFSSDKWWVVAAWIWAVVVAYTRMALGVHYPSDELGSIIISVCLAFIINKFLIRLDFLKGKEIVSDTSQQMNK